ncbi:hypothetical protein [Vibrio sp. AND4]|uniref:hypothetical protein n=1 Tax=Vibrio sp. AND4 TaxID=314289 RepID=UPI00015EFB25|nr:hypothetical protein [Vibrio sp. AND4]EDP60144.1 hypothetical protein AND4_02008 [Vibrio sp. AND4]
MISVNTSLVDNSSRINSVQDVEGAQKISPLALNVSKNPQLTGSANLSSAHRVESLFSQNQRETFANFPQTVQTALLETPYLKEKSDTLSNQEFAKVLSAAGHLETCLGSSSSNLQLFANASLGNVFKVGDSTVLLKALERLPASESVNHARDAVSKLEGTKTPANYSNASQALMNVHKTLETGSQDQARIGGLAEQLRCEGLAQLRDQFKQQLIEQFSGLTKGGSESAVSISLDIGGALGLFNLEAASATVKLKYDFKVFGSDDTKIREKHNFSLGVAGSGASGAPVNINVGGNLGLGTAQVFPNLKSFVDYHANDMVAMLAGSGVNKLINLGGIHQARQADQLLESVVVNNHKLQQDLRQHGILEQGDRIETKIKKHGVPVKAETSAKGISIGGGLGIKDFSKISVGGSFSKSETHFTKHTDLLQQLRQQPQRLMARNPDYFSISVPLGGDTKDNEFLGNRKTQSGLKGLKWMEDKALEVSELAKKAKADPASLDIKTGKLNVDVLKAKRAEIKDVITALFKEYDSYSTIVNQKDSNKSSDARKQMSIIKHSMENDRGSNGRGEYLRAVICSHVALTQTYLASFSDGEVPYLNKDEAAFCQFLSDVERTYSNPQMNLDQKRHIEKQLTLMSGAQSTNVQKSGNVSVQIPGVNKAVDMVVKHSNITGHINPNNDGEYLNIAFTADIPLGKPSSKERVDGPIIRAAVGEALSQFLSKNAIEVELANDATLGLEGALGLGAKLELNMVRGEDNKFHIQYIRATESITVGSKGAAAAGAVKLGGGVSVSSNIHLSERLGDDTLTYLQKKFNGWSVGQQPELWQSYCDNHQKDLGKLFTNLLEPSSNASLELTKMVGDTADMKVLKSDLINKIGEWATDKSEAKFNNALDGFNKVLAGQHSAFKNEAASRFSAK